MNNAAMISNAPAGIDLRSDYERELESYIEARRALVRRRLNFVRDAELALIQNWRALKAEHSA